MFFDGWSSIGRTVLVGMLSYAALVLMLRVSGKRTLSKLNAFDFVITIALGSTLSAMVLDTQVSLAQGVAALGALIGLQYAVAWTCARSTMLAKVVKSDPATVFRDGSYVDDQLRRERLTRSEIDAAIRAAGLTSGGDVHSVVMETNGELSVLVKRPNHSAGVAIPAPASKLDARPS